MQIRVKLIEIFPDNTSMTWNDIFALEYKESTVLDLICRVIADNERDAIEKIKPTASFPDDWATDIELSDSQTSDLLKIRIFGHWKKYRAPMEATLLDGSYCLTNNSFQGTQFGPLIDTQNMHPGEPWIEIKDDDPVMQQATRMIAIRYQGKVREALLEQLGSKLAHS